MVVRGLRVAGAVYKIFEATKAGEEGPRSREGTRKIPSQFAGEVVGFHFIFSDFFCRP